MAKVKKEFAKYKEAMDFFNSLDREIYIAVIAPIGEKWIVSYFEKNIDKR